MKFITRNMLLVLSFLILSGCAANSSPALSSTQSWQGWTSVLAILESSMVDAQGQQLATKDDFQAKVVSTQPVSPTPNVATTDPTMTNTVSVQKQLATIEVTMYAFDQLNKVTLNNVPVDQNNVPTPDSVAKFQQAAQSFKNQVFSQTSRPAATPANQTPDDVLRAYETENGAL